MWKSKSNQNQKKKVDGQKNKPTWGDRDCVELDEEEALAAGGQH
jgi:hypothetical protein